MIQNPFGILVGLAAVVIGILLVTNGILKKSGKIKSESSWAVNTIIGLVAIVYGGTILYGLIFLQIK